MIYLDNAATTKPYDEVIEILKEASLKDFMNPSSLHEGGLLVSNKIELARKSIADLLHVNKDEIFFTSGGTEANNLAINMASGGIITTIAEHPSVLSPIERKKSKQKVYYVKIDKYAKANLDSLEELLTGDVSFISIMHINNELGTINNIDEIGKLIKLKCPDAIFHVDGVCSFSKEFISLRYVDLFTFSSHKINGPKGVGAIWARSSYKDKLKPLFFGGSQENKKRPGTENSAAILAFAKASEISFENNLSNKIKIKSLKTEFIKNLENLKVDYVVNSPEDGSCYILNISFLKIKAQVLVNALSSEGIYVSTGAACSLNDKKNILKSLSLPDEISETALRISFSHENTIEEMIIVAEKIAYFSKILAI